MPCLSYTRTFLRSYTFFVPNNQQTKRRKLNDSTYFCGQECFSAQDAAEDVDVLATSQLSSRAATASHLLSIIDTLTVVLTVDGYLLYGGVGGSP